MFTKSSKQAVKACWPPQERCVVWERRWSPSLDKEHHPETPWNSEIVTEMDWALHHSQPGWQIGISPWTPRKHVLDISGLSCLKIEAYKANGRVEPPLLPIEIEGELEYEVERILDKRINKLGCRRDSVEYLVKWLGYGLSITIGNQQKQLLMHSSWFNLLRIDPCLWWICNLLILIP